MKVSELVSKLKKFASKFGDLEVNIYDTGEYIQITSVLADEKSISLYITENG